MLETNPAAAQPQSQQPPMGASSATGPTPNKGYEAAVLQRLGLVVKQLEEMVPMAGATTPTGKAILSALQSLVKLVPAGSTSPASEQNNIQQMSMRSQQNNQQMQALKQQLQQAAGAQGGAGAGGAQGGGMPGMRAA